MTNVFEFAKRAVGGGNSSQEPPDNGDMEARLRALETALPTLATKADMAELRADVSEMKSDVKSSIADLRAAISDGKVDVQRWILGTVIGLFVGFGGLFLAMSNALKPAPQPTAASQPVIINVPSGAATASPPAAGK